MLLSFLRKRWGNSFNFPYQNYVYIIVLQKPHAYINMSSLIKYMYDRAYSNALNTKADEQTAKARASLRISSPQSFLYLVIFLNIPGALSLITPDNRWPLFIALAIFFFGNRLLVSWLLKVLKVSEVGTTQELEQRLQQAPNLYEYLYWGYQLLPILLLVGSLWWRFYK